MAWRTQRFVENPPHLPYFVTGRYYGNPYATAFTTSILSQGLMKIIPIFIPNPRGVTISHLGYEVTVAGSGATVLFGLYGCTPDGMPGLRLFDSGPLAISGTGFLDSTINLTVRQGWLFMTTVTTATTTMPTVRISNVSSEARSAVIGFESGINTTNSIGYSTLNSQTDGAAFTANGMPKHLPMTGATYVVGAAMERVLIGV